MLPNMHPADELSLVRSEMRKLRAREAVLRRGFLNGKLPRDGTIARVDLSVQRRRLLQRDSLPPEIANNPKYWQMRESQVVTVQERSMEWEEDPGLDDLMVIEPFE